jgi:hypothetical protein
MNKHPVAIIVTRLLRGALLLVLVLIAINIIWFAQGQPQSGNKSPTNFETARNGVHSVNAAKRRDQACPERSRNGYAQPNTYLYARSHTNAPPNSTRSPDSALEERTLPFS